MHAIQAASRREALSSAGRHRLRLPAAGHSRRRHIRRLHLRAGGPRRQQDIDFLADNVKKFMAAAQQAPRAGRRDYHSYLPHVPQVYVDVDRDKVLKQGVNIGDVYQTLQAFMGGYFVNYFNRFGRQWQVYVEAEGEYRTRAENLGQFYVRNSDGGMRAA